MTTPGDAALLPVVSAVVDTARAHDPLDAPLPADAAFRLAPLLAILDLGTATAVAVGHVEVTVVAGEPPVLRARVRGLWLSASKAAVGTAAPEPGPRRWRGVIDHPEVVAAAVGWLRARSGPTDGDPEQVATVLSKDVAESSRDAVQELRSLRYELESHLSATIRGESRSRLDVVLADLVELSVIAGRARDEAREAARSGLDAWRSVPAAYHARRRLQDPALPPRPGAEAAQAESWFALYDASVRQCQAAEQLLGEEVQLLQGRLTAASTVAIARDAQAQESLTLLATVGGVALGVPGIIVGLYGVSNVLPLHWDSRSAAVIAPIALASILASVLAFVTTAGGVRRRLRRAGVTLLAVLVMVAVVAVAGYSFPAA